MEVLKDIQKICQENDVQLIVVDLPFREQVEKRKFDEAYSFDLPQKYIEQFAKQNGISYLDLLPALRRSFWDEKKQLYLSNDVHLTNDGHRLVGEVVSKFFVEQERKN